MIRLFPFLLLATIAHARTVRLVWDANPEPDIAGYVVSYVQPPLLPVALPQTAETTITTPDLSPGVTYTFTVVAVNAEGLVSLPSVPLVVTIPNPPAAPTGLRVVEIQVSSNLADWKSIAYVPLVPTQEFVRARITAIEAP